MPRTRLHPQRPPADMRVARRALAVFTASPRSISFTSKPSNRALTHKPWRRRLPLAVIGLGLALLLAVMRPVPVPAVADAAMPPASRIDPALALRLAVAEPGELLPVIVHLASPLAQPGQPSAPSAQVESQLRQRAAHLQAPLLAWLQARQAEGQVRGLTPFWVFDGLALSASPAVLHVLADRPDVARVTLDQIVLAPRGLPDTPVPVEPNLAVIGAPRAWALGATGQGVVVALLDTGVDLADPALRARWRGGPHDWFDPYGEHPDAPVDGQGHGTQVLGVILGGDAGGARIGVAPDAQWIAARVFDDRGRASAAAIHKALQWVLDPDGNPATADAPRVVNNSWSLANAGCDLEFADDLRALRAAGIVPVFAAGVSVPISPANLPGALSVGALAQDGSLLADSAQGPSACGGAEVYPRLVAPGEGIRTVDRSGLSVTAQGTSLAAAHVSGALALVLSADPSLTADELETALTSTAVDLGKPGPDNQFGYGRVDAAAAVARVRPAPPKPWWLALPLVIGLAVAAVWLRRVLAKTSPPAPHD